MAAPSEQAPARWVEVAVATGNGPLQISTLETPARFVLDAASTGDVVLDRGGRPFVRVPAAARYACFSDGGRTSSRAEAERSGLAVREPDGAALFELRLGRRCRFDVGNTTVEVAAITAPTAEAGWSRAHWLLLAISLVLNVLAFVVLLRG